jgi:hypothetical protein
MRSAPGGSNASSGASWVALTVGNSNAARQAFPCYQTTPLIVRVYGSGLSGFYHPSLPSGGTGSYDDLICSFVDTSNANNRINTNAVT